MTTTTGDSKQNGVGAALSSLINYGADINPEYSYGLKINGTNKKKRVNLSQSGRK